MSARLRQTRSISRSAPTAMRFLVAPHTPQAASPRSPLVRWQSRLLRAQPHIAYGGPDRRTVFITESETGTILTATLEVPGKPMYSHQ